MLQWAAVLELLVDVFGHESAIVRVSSHTFTKLYLDGCLTVHSNDRHFTLPKDRVSKGYFCF